MKAIFGLLNMRELAKVLVYGEDISVLTTQDSVLVVSGLWRQVFFTSMTVDKFGNGGFYSNDFSETLEQVFELFPILKDFEAVVGELL